jgi:hypothetical protein
MSDAEFTIAKLNRYKSPGTDINSAELIQEVGEKLWTEIRNSIILFGARLIPRAVEGASYCTNLQEGHITINFIQNCIQRARLIVKSIGRQN